MSRKNCFVPAIVAACCLFPAGGLGAAESEPVVPERLVHAQYLALGYDLGDRVVAAEALLGSSWRATPREREALEEIRNRLEGWGQYVVVDRLAHAELLLVVRQGQRASAVGGVGGVSGVGSRGGPGGGVQPAYGGSLSSPDDMIAVYDTSGSPSTPLWRMLASDGLSGELPLFEAFRADVERALARRKQP